MLCFNYYNLASSHVVQQTKTKLAYIPKPVFNEMPKTSGAKVLWAASHTMKSLQDSTMQNATIRIDKKYRIIYFTKLHGMYPPKNGSMHH